eukprot:TRINITY_DN6250_c0_g1_i1.p1 TRINITY_DN6250_c0_g1~~TRINITY_DN6250_c0_g1_i1.p1  ORF type:complete len:590 (+),score=134.55 TRINITY_DN6250_c0_g1_i1:54-1823(+)
MDEPTDTIDLFDILAVLETHGGYLKNQQLHDVSVDAMEQSYDILTNTRLKIEATIEGLKRQGNTTELIDMYTDVYHKVLEQEEAIRNALLDKKLLPVDQVRSGVIDHSEWGVNIDLGDINYDPETDFIGAGEYGSVFKGTCRGRKVAIKVPKKRLTPREMEVFTQEIMYMSKISYHPNIVLFMGACVGPTIHMITELCHTDLETMLKKHPNLPLKERIFFARDAALGMNWLHGGKIVHRDLKPANLLVDSNGILKVADFGFCRLFSEGEGFIEHAGTPLWMAPEILKNEMANEKCDVYSFGLIIYEIFTNKRPFKDIQDINELIDVVTRGIRPNITADDMISPLPELIKSCWDNNPRARPDFSTIVYRINEAHVSHLISDPCGRLFWKKHFIHNQTNDLEELVQWDDFKEILKDEIGLMNYDLIDKIKEFVLKKNKKNLFVEDVVSMESFNLALAWFGPFVNAKYGNRILFLVDLIQKKGWFHGAISKTKANSRLEGDSRIGSYLIRLSSTDPLNYPLTLSIVSENRSIMHWRISQHNPGKANQRYGISFKGKKVKFNTLYELIDACKIKLNLREPCVIKSDGGGNYNH